MDNDITFHPFLTYAVRDAELPSVGWVSEKTGVSRQTLNNWYKNRPELIKIILFGCQKVAESEE